MVSKDKLKAVLAYNGYTQQDMAYILGISPTSFSHKINEGNFTGREIELMIILLDFTGFDMTEVMFTEWKKYKPLADRVIHHKNV